MEQRGLKPGKHGAPGNALDRDFSTRAHINRLKPFRELTTCYCREPRNFLAALKIVAARIWIASL